MRRIAQWLGSKAFLYTIFGFFLFESAWIALSALYPQAFDEDFHLGIIKIYGQHWLPFLHDQPPNATAFGAVARDPSYLYHYLMSFPYRLSAVFTHDQALQVIFLRLLNIGMFGAGLALFWRLLRRVGVSAAYTNTVFALFVLIPIVPLLAGQINYDNLMLPLAAWLCWLVLDCAEQLRTRRIALKTITALITVCCLGSLVKYPFLPLALVAFVYLCVVGIRAFRGHCAQAWSSMRSNAKTLSVWMKLALVVTLLVSIGLFVQRYGSNVVSYHSPLPHCETVLSVDDCMDYGPWARDYSLAQHNAGNFNHSVFYYVWAWLYGMWLRLFFMITGPTNTYANSPPLPFPALTAIVLAIAGIGMLVGRLRKTLRGRPDLVFLLLLVGVYMGVLFVDNYLAYLRTSQPVAINGRYLLPVLLPLAAVIGHAARGLLARRTTLKALGASLAIIFFLEGGGWFSFIVRSNPAWDFPNPTTVQINNATRSIVSPLILGQHLHIYD